MVTFADPAVEAICLANWDNGDGYFMKSEAEAVTNVRIVFQNADITSFNEFGLFTGVTSLVDAAFRYCSSLEYLTIPKNVASMGWRALDSCSGLKVLVILKEGSILAANSNALSGMAVSEAIYVPDDLVESYKTASYWSNFADKFKPLSEYTE